MLKGKVDAVGEIPVKKIVFNEELLKGCETNRCGRYNRNWMCPPALADQRALVDKYKNTSALLSFQDCFWTTPLTRRGWNAAVRRWKL